MSTTGSKALSKDAALLIQAPASPCLSAIKRQPQSTSPSQLNCNDTDHSTPSNIRRIELKCPSEASTCFIHSQRTCSTLVTVICETFWKCKFAKSEDKVTWDGGVSICFSAKAILVRMDGRVLVRLNRSMNLTDRLLPAFFLTTGPVVVNG